MATELNKDLTRVSTDKVDDKEITIILRADQNIELKLKGSRKKGQTISILELYNQLNGIEEEVKKSGSISIKKEILKPKRGDKKMISLYDLRSQNAISTLEIGLRARFDGIIKNVIDSHK